MKEARKTQKASLCRILGKIFLILDNYICQNLHGQMSMINTVVLPHCQMLLLVSLCHCVSPSLRPDAVSLGFTLPAGHASWHCSCLQRRNDISGNPNLRSASSMRVLGVSLLLGTPRLEMATPCCCKGLSFPSFSCCLGLRLV